MVQGLDFCRWLLKNARMANQRDVWFEKGRKFKQAKDFDSAVLCFQAMLRENPQDPLALNELFKCHLAQGRLKEGVDAVNRLMKIYVTQAKKNEALLLFGEVMQAKPHHCFDQEVQVLLADWLGEVGDHLGEVEALQIYARRYAHDVRSADILLRAARLAQSKLSDQATCKRIADWICEKYPDSKAAEAAAALYFALKA